MSIARRNFLVGCLAAVASPLAWFRKPKSVPKPVTIWGVPVKWIDPFPTFDCNVGYESSHVRVCRWESGRVEVSSNGQQWVPCPGVDWDLGWRVFRLDRRGAIRFRFVNATTLDLDWVMLSQESPIIYPLVPLGERPATVVDWERRVFGEKHHG